MRKKLIFLFLKFITPQKLIDWGIISFFKRVTWHKNDQLLYDHEWRLFYEAGSEIGSLLFWRQGFEEEDIRFFSGVINKKKHQVLFDIGANIGVHTVQWLNLSSSLKMVYAFEPSQTTKVILEKNIIEHNLNERVTSVSIALADFNGEASFFEAADNAYSALKDTGRKLIKTTYTVPVQTIDTFITQQQVSKVDFIKIDVEGAEEQVIKGGIETLKKFKPDLFIEIYKGVNSNNNPEHTVQMLLDIGYKAYVLNKGVPVPFVACNDELYNYYFTVD